MQTKKRAKPVKFGVKNKSDSHKDESVEKVIKKVDEEIEKLSSDTDNTDKKNASDKSLPTEKGFQAEESETINDDTLPEESEHIITAPDEEENIEDEKNDDDKVISPDSMDYKDDKEDANENDKEEKKLEKKETVLNKDVTFFNVPPDGYNKKKSMWPYFFKVMIATFVLGLVFFAGVYYAVKNQRVKIPAIFKMPAEVTKVPPTEVPTPKPVDLSIYSISVLNGSGTAGEAAKLKSLLTDEGFKVENVGNADKNSYINTEIAANSKVEKEYLEKLRAVLGEVYSVDSSLKVASGDADVVITIGSSSAK